MNICIYKTVRRESFVSKYWAYTYMHICTSHANLMKNKYFFRGLVERNYSQDTKDVGIESLNIGIGDKSIMLVRQPTQCQASRGHYPRTRVVCGLVLQGHRRCVQNG